MVIRRNVVAWLGALLSVLKVQPALAQPDERRFDPAAFPYPVVTVDGALVVETCDRLRQAGDGFPIVIGDDFSAALVSEAVATNDPSLADILKAAAKTAYPQALLGFQAAEQRLYAAQLGEVIKEEPPEIGEWPASVDAFEPLSLYWTMSPDKPVHIAVLPISDPMEAPAYLRFGGYNACPPSDVHVAALRSFRDRYGAEIVLCTHDTLELRIAKPPATREEAMALARELYRYCPDSVDQGVETLSNLAAFLMASNGWFLWWD